MAASAELRVVVRWNEGGEGVRLMQRLAQEVVECYVHLDELARLAGGRPYPRNQDLIDDVEAWVKTLAVTTEDATEGAPAL